MDIRPGMVISIRTRRDVVVVDPERFLAAARAAAAAHDGAVEDAYDAVHALLDLDPQLIPLGDEPEVGRGAPRPGARDTDRPDGLSAAGYVQEIVLTEATPLQDYGCFLPDDLFGGDGRGAA
ncbi:hypothetical protein ACQP00_01890 [Dactylosporangium sp. CS-047395]|uniref:hypothetical protein n=1 Tax=Dactylosporangium sp. CS-047395 TaxID=3239936 RepID=UPI003D90321D